MPSGGVSVRARGDGNMLSTLAQARASKRQSPGAPESPSALSPARQLDFRDVDRDDEDDDGETVKSRPRQRKKRASQVAARDRMRAVVAEEQASDVAAEQPATPETPPRKKRATGESSPSTPGLRRPVLMWTKQEEAQLVAGVRKYGLGHWVEILAEGDGIFHSHRTNVDLKDKWKNLVRKEAKSPLKEQRNRLAKRTASRLSFSSQGVDDEDNASVVSSPHSTGFDEDTSPQNMEEDPVDTSRVARRRRSSEGGTESIRLSICTDDTAPHMRSLSIARQRCGTITALKRELTSRLLNDSPFITNLQLVSIRTRRLLADLEALDDCVERDGHEFYLLYDA